MSKPQYVYKFPEDTPIEEVGCFLCMSAIVAESLHGRSTLRLECTFLLDKEKRECVVTAASQVGRDLACVFTGFLTRGFGEKAFKVRLENEVEHAAVEGGAR